MENTNNNIFAQIILEQAHLYFIDEQLEELYNNTEDEYMKNRETDEQDEATLNFLMQEKIATNDRIRELKKDYIDAMNPNTVTGKIEITYENIPDDVRWKVYHFLNRLALDVPGFGYKTIENETKYSKDYKNE